MNYKKLLFLYILLFFPITDLISSYIFSITGSEATIIFRLLRDIVTITLAILALNSRVLPRNLQVFFIFWLLFITTYMIIGIIKGIQAYVALKSSATLCLPFLILFAAMAGVGDKNDISKVAFIMIIIGFINSAFSLWEINNTDFWQFNLDYGHYLTSIKGVITGFDPATGLPWNFHADDGTRRAAGLLAAPLANGFFMASLSLIVISSFKGYHKIVIGLPLTLFFIFILYSSGTRGGILVLLFAMLFYFILHASRPIYLLGFVLFTTLFSALFLERLINIVVIAANFEDGSTIGHIAALSKNITDLDMVMMFGLGVGQAGSVAAYTGNEISGGGEGAFFSIAYQLGFPIALFFIAYYYYLMRLLYRYSKKYSDLRDHSIGACSLLVGCSSSLILSEHILTYSGMATAWIWSGTVISVCARRDSLETQREGSPIHENHSHL